MVILGISILITSESKASSINCKRAWDTKLISSNKRGWPYLNAFKNVLLEIPSNEFSDLSKLLKYFLII